ncbi:hypothetical protein [Actinomadura flavalba]|uniref:hypothetical protein n=1 Tax=Actinomadura flavalba TaxID=1120938 RepID=UPI0003A540EB|nr:hypothetical protein [Actinomadura flavalba]
MLAVIVGLLVAGGKGALGAAVGALITIAFFAISKLVVGYVATISEHLITGAAMLSYLIKIVGLFGLILLFKDADLWNDLVFGYTIIALIIVWITAEARLVLRTRTLELNDTTPNRTP